jgi:hypothetical protein
MNTVIHAGYMNLFQQVSFALIGKQPAHRDTVILESYEGNDTPCSGKDGE